MRWEGQEEPVTVTMLFAAGQLGRPETLVRPHSLSFSLSLMHTHICTKIHTCAH